MGSEDRFPDIFFVRDYYGKPLVCRCRDGVEYHQRKRFIKCRGMEIFVFLSVCFFEKTAGICFAAVFLQAQMEDFLLQRCCLLAGICAWIFSGGKYIEYRNCRVVVLHTDFVSPLFYICARLFDAFTQERQRGE